MSEAVNIEGILVNIIQDLEKAKNGIEVLRAARRDEEVDGRALSIATTHLETAQLWVANARK